MTDETVLQRLEDIGNCKYDIQVAAHVHKLKEDLKSDIKAAQKKLEEVKPSASHNKAIIAITLKGIIL